MVFNISYEPFQWRIFKDLKKKFNKNKTFMLSSIIKVKDKVEYLLENYPIFRDDDNKLIAKIWYSETRSKNLRDFMIEFGDKKISSPEAIRRARQKLQEHNPHLRGKLYAKRHGNGKTVKSGIKFINF